MAFAVVESRCQVQQNGNLTLVVLVAAGVLSFEAVAFRLQSGLGLALELGLALAFAFDRLGGILTWRRG